MPEAYVVPLKYSSFMINRVTKGEGCFKELARRFSSVEKPGVITDTYYEGNCYNVRS
jgi:hypothetical protein